MTFPSDLKGIPRTSGGLFSDLTIADPKDWSIAVPATSARATEREPIRIAAVCHVFHIDFASEMLRHLQHIPDRFALFISTDTDAKREQLLELLVGWTRGPVEVRIMPNRGRDIAPKLVGFADVYPCHDIVLHLHSKASTHHGDLAHWREFLLQNLLGSTEIVSSILALFATRPDIGMIGPQHFEPIRKWLGWSGNYPQTSALAQRMGLKLAIDDRIEFPSGSMFWARTAALQPLLDLQMQFEDFPEETGQKDETPAHAIERLFYISTECAGLSWSKVAVRSLFNQTSGIVELMDFEASNMLPKYERRLTRPASAE